MQKTFNEKNSRMLRICHSRKFCPLSGRLILTASFLSLGLLTSSLYATESTLPNFAVETTQQTASRVSGVVKDATGEPIIGASVMEKGTKHGGITDLDGQFTFNTTAAELTLEISFVGYKTVTMRAKAGQMLNVVMQEDSKLIDEVVVVGYGTQKRVTMSSAVATVKGDNIKASVANVSNQLGGQVPGIITRQTSGEPGKDAATVLLRGTSPLVLVDGVERPWEKISQEDIETISVLKDASAVAPYGLKGANGVILINTKRGKQGKATLTYSGSVGFQTPMNVPDFLGSYDALSFYNEALKMDSREHEMLSEDILLKYKENTDKYPNTDWMGEYLRTSATTRHNVSLSGGSEFVSAFISLGYLYQGTMMGSGTGYSRYNLRSNVDFNPTKTTNVAVDINLSFDKKESNYYDGKKMMEDLYRLCTPMIPNKINGLPAMQGGGSSMYMGVHDGADNSDQNNYQNLAITLNQQLPFLKGLSVKGLFSYDRQIYDFKYWQYPFTAYAFNADGDVEAQKGGPVNPELSVGNRQWTNYTVQGHINYANTFGKHSVGVLAVYERRWGNKTDLQAGRKMYEFLIPELNMGSVNKEYQSNSGYSTEYAQHGVVLRFNYNYAERYMLEMAGRYDETYKYAPGERSAFFPSVSVGWRISEEPFLKGKLPFLSNLKLRASYGKSGNPVGDDFAYMAKYNIGSGAVFGRDPVQMQGLSEGAEPNIFQTWETVWKANVGLDVTLWDGLLVAEIDVYRDKRNDKMLSPNAIVSSEYGIGLSKENAGKEERYGFDLALGNNVRFNSGLRMSNNVSLGFTRDKQIEIRESAGSKNNPRKRQTGGRSGRAWGYKAAGLFKDQADIDNWAYQANVLPGDVKYVDINGDGKIDAEDQVVIGVNQTPEVMWGYNLRLEYKNFDFAMFLIGTGGSDYYMGDNGDRNVRYPFRDSVHPRKEHLNSWTESNPDPNADFPRLSATIRNQNYEKSSFWIVNSGYIKLKSVQLGYTVPTRLINRLGMQNLRVYADFYNLWTIYSKMSKDFDSENQAFNSYPQQIVSSFGVNLTF